MDDAETCSAPELSSVTALPTFASRQLELLCCVAHELRSSDRHLGPVLKAILAHLATIAGMERGMVTVLDPSRDLARVDVAHGLSAEQQARGRYQLGEGVIGKVLDRGEAAIVPIVGAEPLFLDRTEARRDLDRSKIAFLCAPVTHRGEVIGTLSVDRVYGGALSLDDDLRILEIIATMIGQAVRQRREQAEEADHCKREARRTALQRTPRGPTSLIGTSVSIQAVIELLHKVAPSEATVLIRGESGTGKELIAQAIHAESARRDGPFVAVNCGAIPDHLVESELFGSVRGAFTGAVMNRTGRFEAANGGTLFLDEIGELAAANQVKLLRALQTRQIDRVGDNRSRPIDVRVVAATNANLERMIQDGRFRDDLYYRLNVFPICVPPLRERKSDIALLGDYFRTRYAAEYVREVSSIDAQALERMNAYAWPGNVRELENCIARAVLLTEDHVIGEQHLPPALQERKSSTASRPGALRDALLAYERELLIDAMNEAAGNQSQAARALGTTPRILGYRLRRLGLHTGLSLVKSRTAL